MSDNSATSSSASSISWDGPPEADEGRAVLLDLVVVVVLLLLLPLESERAILKRPRLVLLLRFLATAPNGLSSNALNGSFVRDSCGVSVVSRSGDEALETAECEDVARGPLLCVRPFSLEFRRSLLAGGAIKIGVLLNVELLIAVRSCNFGRNIRKFLFEGSSAIGTAATVAGASIGLMVLEELLLLAE